MIRSPEPQVASFTADPARSTALPGYLYSDPAVFAEEKRRLFYKSWQIVAHESELPQAGDYVCATIVDQSVFVLRGRDRQVRAFFNVCQHRAHELLKGRGNVKSVIVCPYHAWSYELDGSLRAARATPNLPAFDPKEYGLAPVRLERHLGFLFVNLDPEAPSVSALAGGMFADMARELPWLGDLTFNPAYSFTEETGSLLQANWKVMAENCLECYHCGPAHKAYVDMIDVGHYELTRHDAWMKSSAPLRRNDNSAYHVGPEEPVQHNVFWHLFPNIEFSVMPGARALSAFYFTPVDAEQTRISWVTLTMPGEQLPQDRLDYLGKVLWLEDAAICESVHRGLKSLGYRRGRFVASDDHANISEINVHAFQRQYAEAMGL
ncbi:aromatic ring-hydroxylating oxygenase subunit alpha [Dongia deserti]|uniref:aromatic ring-hydroxylating oxygenase subunit alpha n=1 Tax=Dongia deserti TaxID=2268030 RepID=UPI0013C47F37|nr:aromatic ring-hydroxylating dioxygenase subunit alpha [Dongia deserti]